MHGTPLSLAQNWDTFRTLSAAVVRNVEILIGSKDLPYGTGDIAFADGRIVDPATLPAGTPEFDGTGCFVMEPACDLHVHCREPAPNAAATVAEVLSVAERSGFGEIVAMPNTVPPVDTPDRVREQLALAAALHSPVQFRVSACITQGRTGHAPIAPLRDLVAAGASALTDDGTYVSDDAVMAEAIAVAKELNVPIFQHAVDPAIAKKGVVRPCRVQREGNLEIFPDEAEDVAIARDARLAAAANATHCVYAQHVSTTNIAPAFTSENAVRGVMDGEATPHHLLLCADDIPCDDANWKMNPPLPSAKGRAALRRAVLDGAVTCFTTDHAPHAPEGKARGFAAAPFGIIGLETALAASWEAMVEQEGMEPARWANAWTSAPAQRLHHTHTRLGFGAPARLTFVERIPEGYTFTEDMILSRCKNTPMVGQRFHIRPLGLLAK